MQNASRAALLVAALSQGRFDLLDEATADRLHQPARAKLFPAMYAIFDAAKAAGAHCAYLSGGGSTICALCSDERAGDRRRDAGGGPQPRGGGGDADHRQERAQT